MHKDLLVWSLAVGSMSARVGDGDLVRSAGVPAILYHHCSYEDGCIPDPVASDDLIVNTWQLEQAELDRPSSRRSVIS